jgi:hypothetical protein
VTPPRFRVDERRRGLAAYIVGFADTASASRALLAGRAARPRREGGEAELVVVEQATEVVVARRQVAAA